MSAKNVLLAQYDLHHRLFNNVIDNISDIEASKSVFAPMNNIKWLAGHLLWVQRSYAQMGGTNVMIPWVDHFASGPGVTEEDRNAPKSEMPALADIKNKWNEIAPAIRAGLDSLPDAALDTVIEVIHPFDNTLSGLWAFINHHQAYTIGQIGILRRGLGKEALKYN